MVAILYWSKQVSNQADLKAAEIVLLLKESIKLLNLFVSQMFQL